MSRAVRRFPLYIFNLGVTVGRGPIFNLGVTVGRGPQVKGAGVAAAPKPSIYLT